MYQRIQKGKTWLTLCIRNSDYRSRRINREILAGIDSNIEKVEAVH